MSAHVPTSGSISRGYPLKRIDVVAELLYEEGIEAENDAAALLELQSVLQGKPPIYSRQLRTLDHVAYLSSNDVLEQMPENLMGAVHKTCDEISEAQEEWTQGIARDISRVLSHYRGLIFCADSNAPAAYRPIDAAFMVVSDDRPYGDCRILAMSGERIIQPDPALEVYVDTRRLLHLA